MSQVHQQSCTNKAVYKFPTEYAEHTEHSGRESLPQIGTDAHRLGGYGIPAIPTPPITQPNHLWKSVKSVGEYYHAGAAASAAPTKQTGRECPTEYAEHTEHSGREVPPTDRHGCAQIRRQKRNLKICENLRNLWEDFRGWRGYGRMPYPPTKTPTDCTDVHRLGATNAT